MSTGTNQVTLTRRRFLRCSQSALAALGMPPALASSLEIASESARKTTGAVGAGDDYYEKLGVHKIINAAGTYTNLTAAVMPP